MGFSERGLFFALVLGATLLAPPVSAGSIYGWRNEDGVHAYTDDERAIPERYRNSVVVSKSRGLVGYERLTVQKGSRGADHGKRIQERLQALREDHARALENAGAAQAVSAPGGAVVSLGSAGLGQPRVELSAADPATLEPLVIESLITRRHGDLHTRRSTVIRQGERTLVIVKGERHHRSPSRDVIDERDL